MKLDKIRFARLIVMVTRFAGRTLNSEEIEAFDHICDIDAPEPQSIYPKNENVEALMKHMVEGTSKLDAIKEHRTITGMPLRDSKEAVERYWISKVEFDQ